jgi:hypothetical protein
MIFVIGIFSVALLIIKVQRENITAMISVILYTYDDWK